MTSNSTSLLRQGQIVQVAWDHVQLSFGYLHRLKCCFLALVVDLMCLVGHTPVLICTAI